MSGKFALVVGNTEYTDTGLAQLTAPGRDAEDFARVLRDKDICSFDHVEVLLNRHSASVIEAIDAFFDQRKPDDLLVLYFSGHGIRDEIGSLYLGFKNTIRSRLRSTAIKSDYIREAMDQSRSKRQVLILDCCNSGAFPQGTKAELGGSMGMTRAFQGYGRFVLTASDATQFAWEGDRIIGETDNSLFTHFLVKGLEGEADSDGDGKITVDELYDYAFHEISRVTPKQTPTKSSSKQEGEIVLRHFTSFEDIKPAPLPAALLDSIENPIADVRLGAVQHLAKLLNGKNFGLARSAKEALTRIAQGDDSHRVALAAKQALESASYVDGLIDQNPKTEQSAIAEKVEPFRYKAIDEPKTQERKATKNKSNEESEQERLVRERAEAIKAARNREQQERQLKLQKKPMATAGVESKIQAQKPRKQQNNKKVYAVIGFIIFFVICSVGSIMLWPGVSPLPGKVETATTGILASTLSTVPPTIEESTPTLPPTLVTDTSTAPPTETHTATSTLTSTFTFTPSFIPTYTFTSTFTPTRTHTPTSTPVRNSSIVLFVYWDRDKDALYDSGEYLLSATVELYAGSSCTGTVFAMPGAFLGYIFDDLQAGTYCVKVINNSIDNGSECALVPRNGQNTKVYTLDQDKRYEDLGKPGRSGFPYICK